MRIIGGRLGGRRLVGFHGDKIRPTSDKVREALMNMLGDLEGVAWLDVFGGTGAVAIEAHSRGAREVVLIERDRQALDLIAENLRGLGVEGVEVRRGEADKILARLIQDERRFDVIFADPPWAEAVALTRPVLDAAKLLLAPGGRAIVEHDKRTNLDARGLTLVDTRRYGDTALSFFERPLTPEPSSPT